MWGDLSKSLQRLDTVQFRHAEIEKHHIDRIAPGKRDRCRAALHRANHLQHTLPAQHADESGADNGMIIDNEQPNR